MGNWSIGKLARLANVRVDTIRFYEKRGLLAPSRRRASGFREYAQADLELLEFIRDGRALGFPLQEIQRLMKKLAAAQSPEEVLAAGTPLIDERIELLEQWRKRLLSLARELASANEGDSAPDRTTK